jgi:hypothetical protein
LLGVFTGVFVRVGLAVLEGVAVALQVKVRVEVGVLVRVAVGVLEAVAVLDGVLVRVAVGLLDQVAVAVLAGVLVRVAVGLEEGVLVAVRLGVDEAVADGVLVFVGVGVPPGQKAPNIFTSSIWILTAPDNPPHCRAVTWVMSKGWPAPKPRWAMALNCTVTGVQAAGAVMVTP